MNIQMQISGLIIMLLLLYFYKRHETMGLYTEQLFGKALYITIICLILDIISIALIAKQELFPMRAVKIECKAYLASLILNGYMAINYASADTHNLTKVNKLIRKCGWVVGAYCLLVMVLPVELFREGRTVYTYGAACSATYIGALSMILGTVFIVFRHGKLMNPKRRRAIRLWMSIWMAAALIQFLNSQLLLVGFASAMGMVILFFELENPDANIDRRTGFFNSFAFAEYLKQKYREGAELSGMLVTFEDSHTRSVPTDQVEAAMLEIAAFMRRIPEARIFKTDDKEFTLVLESREALERAFRIIDERFQGSWLEFDKNRPNISLQPYYVKVPSGKVAKDAAEMLGMLKYFRIHCMDSPENRVLVVDEANAAKKSAREEMLRTILVAMEEDRVEVFFQPIYATAEKKFVSAEALVRIRNTDGSIIPPGLFIPVAEETGMISKIGEHVFEKTCQFIKEHDIEQYGIAYLEVNLSVVQCESKTLAETYIGIMDKYQIDPKLVNLEITESASIVRKKTLLKNMNTLIDYGVSFSLDDFGNGQSNLNYIVDMPVKIVKFDRDMTQAYFENKKAQFVLKAAMNMIHDMHLHVVSEGVETAEQLAALEQLGIDYVQGYYFSKPIEARAFIEFLKVKNG